MSKTVQVYDGDGEEPVMPKPKCKICGGSGDMSTHLFNKVPLTCIACDGTGEYRPDGIEKFRKMGRAYKKGQINPDYFDTLKIGGTGE